MNYNLNINIGLKIKELRIFKQLTQEELAYKVGYTSRSSINKLEKGLVNIPHSKIISLAEALDTNPSYLMGWTNNPSKDYVEPQRFNIPEQYRDVLVHFSGGADDLTQEDIDSVIDFIEFKKNKRKNKNRQRGACFMW